MRRALLSRVYKLFSVYIGNDTATLDVISALRENPEVDFWNGPTLNRNVSFLIPPGLVEQIQNLLKNAGIEYQILTDDIQRWIDREDEENRPDVFLEQRDITNYAFDKYHRIDEITGYLDLLAQKYSHIATVRNIGMTQEGRPIKGVILSTGSSRPVLWFDAGIHAREWVAPSTLLYFLHKMTTGYGSDSTVTALLQTFDFYIFPVINPDGYAYTFTSDRLWRKNRSGGRRGCRGVDPNRNFATVFGGAGTSGHPCSDIYRGAQAFSEAESRAIRDAILELGSRTKGYVTVHSYSQLLMVPYGHGRGTYTRDYADQIASARAVSRAIQIRSGVYYQVGTISSLLGSSAGSSSDWVYDGAKIKYSLAVELRDKGRYGFLLPNFLIVPTADEAAEGFKAFGKFIARRELNRWRPRATDSRRPRAPSEVDKPLRAVSALSFHGQGEGTCPWAPSSARGSLSGDSPGAQTSRRQLRVVAAADGGASSFPFFPVRKLRQDYFQEARKMHRSIMRVLLSWLLFALFSACNARVSFQGHKLVRAYLNSMSSVELLRNLQTNNTHLDFWDEPVAPDQNITIRLPPSEASMFQKHLELSGIQYTVLTDNLQEWIDRERIDNQRDEDLNPRDAGTFRTDMYHTLDEIYGFLDSSAQKFPSIVTRVTIGKTDEGASIRGVKISSGGNSSRPAMWIDSGIHAREWISTASALYVIDRLLKGYNDSDDITKLVDTFDWYIFPVINADGYKYTWTTHRLWRKNRVRNVASLCRGVDPNRNFDVRFGLAGSSANPCAENYAGTFPFSEAESRAIRDGINNLKDRLKAYINLHSYSQMVMIPYGYSKGYTTDYRSQYEALEKLVTAIRKRNSAFYRHGTAGQTLYITSGAALDWVYDKAKVKHTFVIELRDRGLFGFILPREFITPTGDELFSGLKALAFHIIKSELDS
ncbi:uncharacterized protein LOC144113694 [Amblyomma americanum]